MRLQKAKLRLIYFYFSSSMKILHVSTVGSTLIVALELELLASCNELTDSNISRPLARHLNGQSGFAIFIHWFISFTEFGHLQRRFSTGSAGPNSWIENFPFINFNCVCFFFHRNIEKLLLAISYYDDNHQLITWLSNLDSSSSLSISLMDFE